MYKRQDQILAAVLKKNPRFINEPVYARRLEDEADKIVEQYAVGRLIVAGDNRYLSGEMCIRDRITASMPRICTKMVIKSGAWAEICGEHSK